MGMLLVSNTFCHKPNLMMVWTKGQGLSEVCFLYVKGISVWTKVTDQPSNIVISTYGPMHAVFLSNSNSCSADFQAAAVCCTYTIDPEAHSKCAWIFNNIWIVCIVYVGAVLFSGAVNVFFCMCVCTCMHLCICFFLTVTELSELKSYIYFMVSAGKGYRPGEAGGEPTNTHTASRRSGPVF